MTRAGVGALVSFVVAIGCGGDSGGNDRVDAGGDPPLDAAPTELTVTVTSVDLPLPDIDVVFNRADGTVAAQGRTDADGRFIGEIDAGGSVNVVGETEPDRWETILILDVAPGDDLRIVLDTEGNGAGDIIADTNSIVLPEPFAGANSYRFGYACTDHSTLDVGITTHQTVYYESCPVPSPQNVTPLSVLATDSQQTPLAFTSGSFSGYGQNPTLPAWRTDFSTIDVTVQTPSTDEVDLALALRASGYTYSAHSRALIPASGQATGAVKYLPGFADDATLQIRTGEQLATQFRRYVVRQRWSSPPSTLAVDLAASIPPPVDAITMGPGGVTVTADLAGADGLVLFGFWQDDQGRDINLEIVAPADVTSVPFPDGGINLPIVPYPSAQVTGGGYEVVAADFVADYAAFRRSNEPEALVPDTGDYVLYTLSAETEF